MCGKNADFSCRMQSPVTQTADVYSALPSAGMNGAPEKWCRIQLIKCYFSPAAASRSKKNLGSSDWESGNDALSFSSSSLNRCPLQVLLLKASSFQGVEDS